jgi:hypothetical protein
MAYATPDELAAALRVAVSVKNQAALQSCVDAASLEIDHEIDADPAGTPVPPADPLAHMVCIARGVEWFKANDAAFGAIGFDGTGVLSAPRDGFARHAANLTPLKQRFGFG